METSGVEDYLSCAMRSQFLLKSKLCHVTCFTTRNKKWCYFLHITSLESNYSLKDMCGRCHKGGVDSSRIDSIIDGKRGDHSGRRRKCECKDKTKCKCKKEKKPCATSGSTSSEIWCNRPDFNGGWSDSSSGSTSSLCGWNCGVKYGGFCGGKCGNQKYGPLKGGCGGGGCGKTAFAKDGCQRVCYKRCDSFCKPCLKPSLVCGAKYAKPNPDKNVGEVPCSPCGPCYAQIGECQPAI